MGNILFLLLTPISHLTFYLAYIAASCVRGVIVAAGVLVAASLFVDLPVTNFFLILFFSVMGSIMLGSLGIIAGIWADKFDQMAAFQNFIILPMTFLSGVFYSVENLPDTWKWISHGNPFFYLIDGFRAGFFGFSDVPIAMSICVVSLVSLALSCACLLIIRSGYKLRA